MNLAGRIHNHPRLQCIDRLLKAKADVDAHAADEHGMTALMFAVHSGSVNCVQRLLRNHPPVNVEAKNKHDQVAAAFAQTDEMRSLVQRERTSSSACALS